MAAACATWRLTIVLDGSAVGSLLCMVCLRVCAVDAFVAEECVWGKLAAHDGGAHTDEVGEAERRGGAAANERGEAGANGAKEWISLRGLRIASLTQ
jgi:hypothetical protein